ncbi:hypothetical protein IMX26_14575 [Clostridium sp. 'deep sea']|uniref:hypothetical protein n=1 Tax=Clostridium sp. 'deep sea' TaxID=2779445 RepID=UPI00189655AF|nr:hypothetical protein [Clostridium sp. 'deep sea']QOR34680.1 hypothetical protein IMX26_14575 [Clostridium sp. 'deep sea']
MKREYHYFLNEDEITKEREEEIIDKLAREIYKRQLEVPAIFLGEIAKPFSFILSSIVHGANPILSPFLDFKTVEQYAFFIEKRANIEKIQCRLEEMKAKEPKKGFFR